MNLIAYSEILYENLSGYGSMGIYYVSLWENVMLPAKNQLSLQTNDIHMTVLTKRCTTLDEKTIFHGNSCI